MGSFSIWHWIVVLVIVVLVFGTKRLGSVGKDVGEAVKGFKKGMRDDDDERGPPAQLRDERRDAPSDAPHSTAAARDEHDRR